ncbi:glycosyltransferase [Delftia tsuruhatensis]|uniref:glycosyltransferase n=1 Tax=Delftia tsuruhatensis TaxID=180282 RepID=UPI00244A78E7|nr:glycosyltransferase [Delftia tsuruhatensis]MDH0418679.1 glycosyltransferase [Delftia tsuruhatensis]
MMRIVIDLQGSQAENKDRGIGRLSLSLAKAIAINRGNYEVLIALNGEFPVSIDAIREEFDSILPQKNIRVWSPLNIPSADGDRPQIHSELLREFFLASLKPDVVLVLSLFEGFSDRAITSIGRVPASYKTVVFLHDLIPLIYADHYLANPSMRAWYLGKIDDLKRADYLICNSNSTKSEAIELAGFSSADVVTVWAGIDSEFRKKNIDEETERNVRERYGLSKSFIMYGGGIDYRKNIEGLIRAYARLPLQTRKDHQLAIVCSIRDVDRWRLVDLAKEHGIDEKDLILTGFVSDEDLLALYNLCKIFVFPSWHEGFGLPALEAMACGRAVIGSNCSSLPEVIGRSDALFDPKNDESIAKKIQHVLSNSEFKTSLELHGVEQSKIFSWERSAKLTISAIEGWLGGEEGQKKKIPFKKPLLAYISPLPPERSGISDYSAELLPELARYYEIEVIVVQDSIADEWIVGNCRKRSVQWFMDHSDNYERVIYHFGNSHYHEHMFGLLRMIPGVVVLHDFFLSGIVAHMEHIGVSPGIWTKSLYSSHGYNAISRRIHAEDTSDAIWEYPCNYSVLDLAQGIIVHSEFSRELARHWYGKNSGDHWKIIPLLRSQRTLDVNSRLSARKALGLSGRSCIVCSFGLLGRTKLNHRLLNAWLQSSLANDPSYTLIFVGENDNGEYGASLERLIAESGLGDRIKITGWLNSGEFQKYLEAADIGVQLRTLSRGETSAAVLDCMNYGLATIVNANGSMGDLPDDGVFKLKDEFEDSQLVEALMMLCEDESYRRDLGTRAREIVKTQHDPASCAASYFEAIEDFQSERLTSIKSLIDRMASIANPILDDTSLRNIASSIDASIVPRIYQTQILVDISELIQRDSRSGIQRVVRSILQEWLKLPLAGYRVEPVYASENGLGYRYARNFTLEFLNCPRSMLEDEPVSYRAGDYFLGLDLQPVIVPKQRDCFQMMRRAGVNVKFVVYDLLLLQFPHCFVPHGDKLLQRWLEVINECDGAICISKSVAADLESWRVENKISNGRPFEIEWSHLGADVENSIPTYGLPSDSEEILNKLTSQSSFLMVGTLEPRKGHEQVLSAFEKLWENGEEINLVLVGKQGWLVEKLVERIVSHREYGKHLFWLNGISDEYLGLVYKSCSCLIAASYGEGFGLPLIESAINELPIMARDISVFREVAGQNAYYFDARNPIELADHILNWLSLYKQKKHPLSSNMSWMTWKECSEKMLGLLIKSDIAQNRASL